MRIRSVTVRNYRIHREQRIEFDPGATLIGGLNETGKSTLAEAIHRAFFLRAKSTGGVVEEMRSRVHTGNPEVEIEFEAKGNTYRLVKQFRGASGVARLQEVGGQVWNGEEAEARLADLLGTEEAAGGKGAAARLRSSWANLWVWQGTASDEPESYAADQSDRLLRQLEKLGGGALVQSELDARLSACFGSERDQRFTQKGEPRTSSDIGDALSQQRQTAAERDAAASVLGSFESDLRQVQEADTALTETARSLPGLEQQQKENESIATKLKELQTTEILQTHAKQTADEQFEALQKSDRQIAAKREEIRKIEATLEPRKAQIEALRIDLTDRKADLGKARLELESVSNRAGDERKNLELFRTAREACDCRARHDALKAQHEGVQNRRKSLIDLESQLAALPSIDAKQIKALEKIETRRLEAEIALRAMQSEIAVLAADREVRVGETALAVGSSCRIADVTEIRVGDGIALQIRPGGGSRLETARQELQEATSDLLNRFQTLGIDTLEAARKIASERTDLEGRIHTGRESLKAMQADGIETDFSVSVVAMNAAEARLKERLTTWNGDPLPADPAQLASAISGAEVSAQELETEQKSLQAKVSGALAAFEKAESDLERENKAIATDEKELLLAQGELAGLIATAGEDAPRAHELAARKQAADRATAELDATRKSITGMQPDLIGQRRVQLANAIANCMQQRSLQEEKRATARGRLTHAGTTDPLATLAIASARAADAEAHARTVERRARSLKRLADLFEEEQRARTDRFTQPFADRISGYLQVLFGPEAHARVRFENNRFAGLGLVRTRDGGSELPFSALSEGAREQVAAAARLAMAEVLAADSDGCLPVLFDDAFAYSDPERVQTLQSMLYRGVGKLSLIHI